MSFYQNLNLYYDILFPANPTQISFIEKYSKPAARILDIAAGTGNQAILLASNGYDVTATDSEEEMVNTMAEKALNENVPLQSIRLEMEKIQLLSTSSYDVIVCIGNSIVHLNSIDEIRNMIKDIYKLLENDGTFIVQTVNYDRILNLQIQELPLIKKPEGISFRRTYEFLDEKIRFNGALTVEKDGEIQQFDHSVELYPLQSFQLVTVLQEAGFSEITLYGDFKENEYSITSPAIIAVAKK
ncbi:class I SAM-dependent methyltransferase [Bacillus sp. 1NLA3E]|jgi:ubiquinone/menaquinone biosynthesis C-methylase UbiE|uniref:class I SAM-dependent methyltransferase n=1 Tax=Bacillus sp. 1NLA3E TaxID=666686 RepID=UPI000247F3E3|nr:class I SAM-dependent methyltransferase [Bacillus sp. 1NLA3E]AGK53860.1 type 11 methyltransferase [Bacillus sp. 1NLA3E]